ncbi:hypothetical protein DACRYDRAFT_108757 [Dacryopinax primogenitus]|uniref:Uncharacterized protein n=1 Tax=Dacryopinax primogenitus (strain DJM 731) TaxID=1858805 RepID=M5FY31_DACPD|nr:uncharacterized protein DACRYDRAFT_108757 [Dacryopinax primogenitus]EJU00690.1 hypothetical protein DACRYDRAFT_108757 [Dacryopinax primogenitus]
MAAEKVYEESDQGLNLVSELVCDLDQQATRSILTMRFFAALVAMLSVVPFKVQAAAVKRTNFGMDTFLTPSTVCPTSVGECFGASNGESFLSFDIHCFS